MSSFYTSKICRYAAACADTMQFIQSYIQVGQTVDQIKTLCETYMLANGAQSFWYYDVGALVFHHPDTLLSVSGRKYVPAHTCIQSNDVLTIHLVTATAAGSGRFARTFVVQKGQVVRQLDDIAEAEIRNGLRFEDQLHAELRRFVDTSTTFEQLYAYMNDYIRAQGYHNLDFNGNLGHSIVKNKNHRIYIEAGNHKKLSRVRLFTFEPHIALINGTYGFKKEDPSF